MLELWRPPREVGDPLGCITTTYTFSPGLFDEQCLANFLGVGAEPNRENLAFLIERESRLGGVYAGVLVDHTMAGEAHSLRWDVLPVRIPLGKQHAKITLLAWQDCLRLVVTSANLSEAGYRSNFEVAASVDLTPAVCDGALLASALQFLRTLVQFVPGGQTVPREVQRARDFLSAVERQASSWKPARPGAARRSLTFTLPGTADTPDGSGSLSMAIDACRKRGGSPHESWIASPFFDIEDEDSRVTSALCKAMARGGGRRLMFCVPGSHTAADGARLKAPKALLMAAERLQAKVSVGVLPELDGDKNARAWHAKMLALEAGGYAALMIGSSNFTGAGMGVGRARNAEANLLTIVDRVRFGRETNDLDALWSMVAPIADPHRAEWLGSSIEEDDGANGAPPVPAGFQLASYQAGDDRRVILRFDPAALPEVWSVHAIGTETRELTSADAWRLAQAPHEMRLEWLPVDPPERLLVRWDGHEGFLPLNVEDARQLPPPSRLTEMTADDMLMVLAAADPSAAIRIWARQQQPSDEFDDDLDSAAPVDIDPLRRYDLSATFLHRVRRRARVLAQVRANLQRPAWSKQVVEWRLTGVIGVQALADRYVRELTHTPESLDEKLLALADFLVVMSEVEYSAADGAVSVADFHRIYRPFLAGLATQLDETVAQFLERLSPDVAGFWNQVVTRCQE